MELTTAWIAMRTIAILQGLYFVITGIWPLLSISTFQAVTGPKPIYGW